MEKLWRVVCTCDDLCDLARPFTHNRNKIDRRKGINDHRNQNRRADHRSKAKSQAPKELKQDHTPERVVNANKAMAVQKLELPAQRNKFLLCICKVFGYGFAPFPDVT